MKPFLKTPKEIITLWTSVYYVAPFVDDIVRSFYSTPPKVMQMSPKKMSIMAELSWLLHFDCRLHSESDTRNISAVFKQTVERAHSPLQYTHEYIYFTAEHYEAYLPVLHKHRGRYHYSYKESNMFPNRTRYNTAVVNRLHCLTGRLYCMMNCFSLHFQFKFIGIVSPITQSWAAHCRAPNNAYRQRILNVERNNVALFNYWNAVLNICACPFC